VRIVFSTSSWDDYLYWQHTDPSIVAKINAIIKDTLRSPFVGIGKPEPLRRDMAGWWSRRITGEHRLVYRVSGSGDAQALEIAACRFHYGR
jgi:toxin YoeB